MKTTLLFTAIIASVFFGCRPKPIDIDIDLHKPKLVIGSSMLPLLDSTSTIDSIKVSDSVILVVSVTKTFSALSNPVQNDTVTGIPNNLLVNDAFVTVSYSGKTDTLYMVVPGIYITILPLQNYEFYTLYVKDPATGDVATSATTLLPKISFDTIFPVVTKMPGDTTISIKYEFTDFPNKNNWYVISYYNYTSSEYTENTSANKKKIDINKYRNKYKVQSKLVLLDDKTFDGKKYVSETFLKDIKSADTVMVSISNISEEYFRFLTIQKRSKSFINQITGEPINYPTNITNGYGYFNLYYLDTRIFDLNKY